MKIYFINIVLIIYWWLVYQLISTMKTNISPYKQPLIKNESIKKGDIVKNILLLLPFIQVYLLLALKSDTVGTDTMSYQYFFYLVKNVTWQNILNFNIGSRFELGFVMLSKSITMFTYTYAVYTIIISVILILPFYTIIKKYSAMPFFSLIIFITLGFFNFYSSGLRQALAMSIVFLSYNSIIKRKMWTFFILVAIATQFHLSAIFFLPAYFLKNLTITRKIGLVYYITLAIAFVFRFQILGYITQFIYKDLQIESTGAYNLLIIVLLTFTIGLFTYKKTIKKDSNNKLLFNLLAITVGLMIVNTISMWGLRVAYYYYIFIILFIPNLVSAYKTKMIRYIAVIVVFGFTLIYYLKIGVNSLNGTPYMFFWQ